MNTIYWILIVAIYVVTMIVEYFLVRSVTIKNTVTRAVNWLYNHYDDSYQLMFHEWIKLFKQNLNN